ncbi:DUF397 domain-containing protein [Actinomadura fulvescens]|uniref:DUF397 domain-containing protein n=1 Tax=Actinomadura fulvescens TaxID=46160 RepID=A0ABN3Q226_9ACTN
MIEWRKASKSNTEGSACVEVADLSGRVGVRDSKDPHGPAFALPVTAARDLMTRIKRGDLDL